VSLHEEACVLCLREKGSTRAPLSAEEFVNELYKKYAPKLAHTEVRPRLRSLLTKSPQIKEKTDEPTKDGGDRS
jgi:hypothetical protein